MAGRSAVYYSIAQRCAEQGENGRAIITILNAFRNNPSYIDMHPEAVTLLAQVLVPGYEDEVHRLETCYPAFGKRLVGELETLGRVDFAHSLEQSFDAYCIDQVKQYHEEYQQEYQSFGMPFGDSGYERVQDISGSFEPDEGERLYSDECPATFDCSWMLTAARMDSRKEVRELVRRDCRREMSSANNLRFDRITLNEIEPVEAETYADNASDRVIIDFDNTIRETPKSAMFAAGQTKIRSYEEEIADFRAREEKEKETEIRREKPEATFGAVPDPMDLVPETTHALNDTPSVEPYVVRHPLRFKLKPQHVITCILLCLLAVLGYMGWQIVAPILEQHTLERISSEYLAASETGVVNPIGTLDETARQLVNEKRMNGYRLFLKIWHDTHHVSEFTRIDPTDESFPAESGAAHAAYISQTLFLGQTEDAVKYFMSLSPAVWREQPYFRLWSQAQLDEAARDYTNASLKYEKLMQTPLAPFALVQLGFLAMAPGLAQNDISMRFIHAVEQTENPSRLTMCAYHVLLHGEGNHAAVRGCQMPTDLLQPYQQYCAMGDVFHSLGQKTPVNPDALALLKNSEPVARGESYRIEAIIMAELELQHPDEAVTFYRELNIPKDHPLRDRLRKAIFGHAMFNADWSSIYAMYPKTRSDMGYLAAMRIMDNAGPDERFTGADIKNPESLLKYGVSESNVLKYMIDDAYSEARSGRYEKALAITRALLTSHPDHWEPLFLQAEILSHTAQYREAASILEQALLMGQKGAPLIIMSNVYRSRAGMPLNPSAYLLPWISLRDNTLESGRCEILAYQKHPKANQCLAELAQRSGQQSKAFWMLNNRGKKVPVTKWYGAGSEAMSLPGYHLNFARTLLKEKQFNNAAAEYSRALLFDPTTATPEIVEEFKNAYIIHTRRIDGTKKFESLIAVMSKKPTQKELLASLHIAVADLYQPGKANPMARLHLTQALQIVGERPEILRGLVLYYETKGSDEQARHYRARLYRLLHKDDAVADE